MAHFQTRINSLHGVRHFSHDHASQMKCMVVTCNKMIVRLMGYGKFNGVWFHVHAGHMKYMVVTCNDIVRLLNSFIGYGFIPLHIYELSFR